MALRAPFTPQHSELNDFLFARLGVDESGMVVTVASAIARSGEDPWQEAERIAGLSHGAAIHALMPIAAQFSETANPDHIRTATARLVQLLPRRRSRKIRFTLRLQPRRWPLAFWLVILLIVAGLLYWTQGPPPAGIEQSPPGFSARSHRRRPSRRRHAARL